MAAPVPHKVCIIGAGCSGFTMAKRFKDHGIAFDCFEASDNIGGNWYYKNPNGTSACYESLHIDTSKWRLAFEDYPVPPEWPDFPHHSLLFQYFNDYVDHFGLRPLITFNTRVEEAIRDDAGQWQIKLSNGETRTYTALVVANGHHWDPRIPDYPGQENFSGPILHSHAYNDPFDPIDMRGKRILVVGVGNSAMDIASELSQRPIAKSLTVSTRRGVWVFPKYINGQPADKAAAPPWMPGPLGRSIARSMLKKTIGKMEDYGLPKPDHEPLDAHPSVSGEFLTRLGCGDIKVKPGLTRFDQGGVQYTDGSRDDIDVVIYATGYNITFPFFKQERFIARENVLPLYKRMVIPGVDNLFYVGLAQPLPTLVNFAEQQSKLVAGALKGTYAFPSSPDMERAIVSDDKKYLGHFYDSPRHRIQVDFGVYVDDLLKEIKKGERRAKSVSRAG
jgi:hypothetical protein